MKWRQPTPDEIAMNQVPEERVKQLIGAYRELRQLSGDVETIETDTIKALEELLQSRVVLAMLRNACNGVGDD